MFISYAHRDARLKEELLKHLALLRREGLISGWDDRDISAGSVWREAIDQQLASADVILLLVSADFIASDFCYSKEMQHAMRRHNDGSAIVIPILLRPVDWKTAPFGASQASPPNARPITA